MCLHVRGVYGLNHTVYVISPAVMQSNLWSAYYSVTCKASSITALTAASFKHTYWISVYHFFFSAMHPKCFAVECYSFFCPLSPLPSPPSIHPCITPHPLPLLLPNSAQLQPGSKRKLNDSHIVDLLPVNTGMWGRNSECGGKTAHSVLSLVIMTQLWGSKIW